MSSPASRQEQVHRLYGAFVSRDFDALGRDLDAAAEFINPEDAVEPGTRVGAASFVAALARLHDMFDYTGYELRELVDDGDAAVAVVRFFARGRESGVPVDSEFAHLLCWEGDRLRRLEWFRGREDALAALSSR